MARSISIPSTSTSTGGQNAPSKFRTLLTVALLVFTLFSFNFLMKSGSLPSASMGGVSSLYRGFKKAGPKVPIVHPIPELMRQAEDKFLDMLDRQSTTLAEAVAEYKKRYNRNPPKGFDDWFAFAKENDVQIIDEYDQMEADLKPFWVFSGAEIRSRCVQVGLLPSVDLVRVEKGKTRTIDLNTGGDDAEVGARAKGFRTMLEKFQHKLPDMDFPVNEKAEGRVLVPWEQANYANLTADSSKGIEAVLGGEFLPDWRGDSNVWESYRRTCPPTSQARRLFSSRRTTVSKGAAQSPQNLLAAAGVLPGGTNEEFVFPETVDDQFDFCDQPWAHYQQGHFFSDWRTINALYPMFSPAKSHGYSDILIPSHYYHASTKRYTYGWDPVNLRIKEVDDMEMPWDKKMNRIFWRGATTGGGSSPPGFLAQYQRHRFLRMVSDESDNNRTVVFADPPESENYVEAEVSMGILNEDIMDVGFTKAVGCTQYPGGCDGMRKDHSFRDAVPMGAHWGFKMLIDLDGMGYSARFMALLMSKSAVMKATVYREFFSDWIQPWLHYIPVSSSYQEIYNTYAYFNGPTEAMTENANGTYWTERDDWELKKIADEGRNWKMTHARKVDMEVYVYRLALEWGRLVADDRESRTHK